jgi:hypothetical protein
MSVTSANGPSCPVIARGIRWDLEFGSPAWGRFAFGPLSVARSRRQQAELVAVGIGHQHATDVVLPDFEPSRAEREETVDLRSLISIAIGRNVEAPPVAA